MDAKEFIRLDQCEIAGLLAFMSTADSNGNVRGFQYEVPGTGAIIQVGWDDVNESHYIAQNVASKIGA